MFMFRGRLAYSAGLLLFLALGPAPGCKPIQAGVEAYHQGNFSKAIELLAPFAHEQSARIPEFSATVDSEEYLVTILPQITQEYFMGWEAYVGSLFGSGEVEKGCEASAFALRPLTIRLNGTSQRSYDPRIGSHWQPEVMSLRSWWVNIPCQP